MPEKFAANKFLLKNHISPQISYFLSKILIFSQKSSFSLKNPHFLSKILIFSQKSSFSLKNSYFSLKNSYFSLKIHIRPSKFSAFFQNPYSSKKFSNLPKIPQVFQNHQTFQKFFKLSKPSNFLKKANITHLREANS
jgi:hypothetical protein